jgi:hypothetical protein
MGLPLGYHRRMARFASVAAVALAAATCGSCATERPASITVALSSEAPIPTGIDRIRITVTDRGTPKLDRDYTSDRGTRACPGRWSSSARTTRIHPRR